MTAISRNCRALNASERHAAQEAISEQARSLLVTDLVYAMVVKGLTRLAMVTRLFDSDNPSLGGQGFDLDLKLGGFRRRFACAVSSEV